MNRQFRSLVAAALALVVIVSLLGCSDTATPTAVPAAPTKAATTAAAAPTAAATAVPAAAPSAVPTAAPVTIKYGISAPITGPASVPGLTYERAIRMSIDDVNAKGGITVGGKTYRFVAVSVDDKMVSDAAVEGTNRLVLQEKVKFMSITGNTSGAAQPVTEPNKVLLLVAGGIDSQLGLKFPLTLASGYPSARTRLPAIYTQLTKDYPQAKRVAAVWDERNAPVHFPLVDEFAKASGLTIVAKETFPTTLTDFAPLVTRVLAQNPDAIDFSGGSLGPAFLSFTKALAEQGYKKPIFGISGSSSALLAAGASAEGFWYQGIADFSSTSVLTKAEQDIIQRYLKTYSQGEFEPSMLGSYVTVPMLAQAMVKAGTVDDTAKIAQTLREGQWDTMWGKKAFTGAKTFGAPAYLDMNLYLSKVQGGKLITFSSFNGTLP